MRKRHVQKWGFSEARGRIVSNTMFETPTVAPRAGAWIETRARLDILVAECGRSPCGSADICEGKFYTSNMLDLGVDRCGRDVKNSVSMASTVLG